MVQSGAERAPGPASKLRVHPHPSPLSPAPCSCSQGKAADKSEKGPGYMDLGGPDCLDRSAVLT